jgi:hypothetical protein
MKVQSASPAGYNDTARRGKRGRVVMEPDDYDDAPCDNCDGSGRCPDCGGQDGADGTGRVCESCGGTGTCEECGGVGEMHFY